MVKTQTYGVLQTSTFRYTQAVERCVKIVTETSLKVVGEERRDGYLRTILNSRAITPQFKTKKEFKNH